MWIIIGIIAILVVALYATFSNSIDKSQDNIVTYFEENKWWTIGMLADIHNKRKDKK